MNSDNIIIYTDGSCHTQIRVGAWASILFIGKKKIVLTGEENNTTHNRMELMAVIKAVDYLAKNNYNEPVTIYADSQYACEIPSRKEKLKAKGFLTNKGTPIQNSDLVQTLISQIEKYNIQFIKVKAHSKTDDTASIHNSEVDQLVRDMVRKKAAKQ